MNADSDPMQIVSGVVDFASAAAQFLPPPISLIGDAAVGFLGIFFPGLSGPSNQEVIDKLTEEIQEGFKEQRKFISQGFDIQQKLIKQGFDKLTKKIEESNEELKEFLSLNDINDLKLDSGALLEDVNQRKLYLFALEEMREFSDVEIGLITTDIEILGRTEVTSKIRLQFEDKCMKGVFDKNMWVTNAKKEACLIMLYNYLTIEEERALIMNRFIVIRNSGKSNDETSSALWAVYEQRQKLVRDFITRLLQDRNTGCHIVAHKQAYVAQKLQDIRQHMDMVRYISSFGEMNFKRILESEYKTNACGIAPIHCSWGPWDKTWSGTGCTGRDGCGQGRKTRTRTEHGPKYGGTECTGSPPTWQLKCNKIPWNRNCNYKFGKIDTKCYGHVRYCNNGGSQATYRYFCQTDNIPGCGQGERDKWKGCGDAEERCTSSGKEEVESTSQWNCYRKCCSECPAFTAEESNCRDGYEPKMGDMRPGVGSLDKKTNIQTKDECGQFCDENPDCCSYEWSATTKICNLNHECQPIHPKNGDYQFCTKGNCQTRLRAKICTQIKNKKECLTSRDSRTSWGAILLQDQPCAWTTSNQCDMQIVLEKNGKKAGIDFARCYKPSQCNEIKDEGECLASTDSRSSWKNQTLENEPCAWCLNYDACPVGKFCAMKTVLEHNGKKAGIDFKTKQN